MKKALTVILIVCLLASLTACRGKEREQPENTGDPQAMLPTENAELPTEAPTEAPTPEPITCTLLSEANGGPGNYASLGRSAEDATWGKTYFKSEEAPAEAEIEFEGEKYTGVYEDSIFMLFDSYPTHCYYNKKEKYGFGINGNTGEIADFLPGRLEEDSKLPDIDDPERETERLARELAAKYLGDIDEYTMEFVWIEKLEFIDIDIYHYDFTRMAEDGRKTTDFVRVSITSKGTLYGIYFSDINAYPAIAAGCGRFKDLDLEAYMTDVILPCIPESYTASGDVDIVRAVYAVSPYDGEVVFCVEAYFDAVDQNGEGPWAFGGIFILR